MTGEAPRVVLDTNVLLSLFVFADSRFAPIRRTIEDGRWQALADERCLAEFRRVLGYPMFSLDEAARAAAFDAYAALVLPVEPVPGNPVPLPLCEDKDDQKFLELARDGGAALLVTSDKALLRLARRLRTSGQFRLLTPHDALALIPADESAIVGPREAMEPMEPTGHGHGGFC